MIKNVRGVFLQNIWQFIGKLNVQGSSIDINEPLVMTHMLQKSVEAARITLKNITNMNLLDN